MISISDAIQLIQQAVEPLPSETIELSNAVGRVLAADVCSDVDSPPHNKSVMDGFAIRAGDLVNGQAQLRIVETITAGRWPEKSVAPGTASQIMTGAPLPDGADSVVMIEQTEIHESDGQRFVKISVDGFQSGRHVMTRAQNLSKGQTIADKGQKIRPTDIGLLAETGAWNVSVSKNPTVAILPTGDELVAPSELPSRAQIRNSNGPMLNAMTQALGLNVAQLNIGRDEPKQLRSEIEKGLNRDLLLLSGGVSAGMLDLVPKVLSDCGVEQIFHKIAVKPGKPIWFGVRRHSDRNTYVFGLPGNPVSSMVGFQLFVRLAIDAMMGLKETQSWQSAILGADHEVRGNRPTYWPGRMNIDDLNQRSVQPVTWNGSSDLRALGIADCLIYFTPETKLKTAGETVKVFPLV